MSALLIRHQQRLPKVLLGSLAIYLLFVYAPLISQAGISVDDWAILPITLTAAPFGIVMALGFPYFRIDH